MDVERKRERDWPHWPDRGSGPARRDRLERRLFRDTEREAELEQAQAAIRQIEEAAAAKAAQIERLERAVGQVTDPEQPEPVLELEPAPEQEEPEPALEPEPAPEPEPAARAAYLVFVGTPGGYALREAWGEVPAAGGRVALEGVEHVVAKIGRSPLPGDDRRCAYLEPA
jgi:hypothetical protein